MHIHAITKVRIHKLVGPKMSRLTVFFKTSFTISIPNILHIQKTFILTYMLGFKCCLCAFACLHRCASSTFIVLLLNVMKCIPNILTKTRLVRLISKRGIAMESFPHVLNDQQNTDKHYMQNHHTREWINA